ncbi:unnamed protein product [Adineta steineri]|uniref:Uncharacterized protein n=1 Tax=Adineta steineri TaxID=433720 RepID=A0A814PLK5_9BILA|nr:unnamed protein product [Adineta steineri]
MKSLSLVLLQIISPIFYLRCYSTVKMNDIKIEKFFVRDDEQFFPNNNQLPVIVYRQVFDTKSVSASKWEQLFQENNFGKSWRDGIFTYHHYHSTAHEALGCYGGHAQVRLGGDNEQVRKDIELNAGDCILIPTGVAHKNMGQDSEFGVVGAYDLDGKSYDMNYGKDAEERRKAEENMKKVQVPRMDPVVGKKNGGVIEFWQKNTHQNEILMTTDSTSLSEIQKTNVIDQLKRRVTFIKYKSNGRTYSRIYYVNLSEDAIHYQGSKRKSKHEACKIKDIGQIRRGFTTAVWKKYIDKRKITRDKAHLAFSILYDNNRHSLDLLADSENICLQWIQGLEYLIERYRSHVRTHHEITDRWLWSLFSQADRDQSGQLNRREVHQLLRLLNIELDEREIDQYFNQSNIQIVHKRGKRLIIHIISGQHLAKEKNSNDDSDIVDPYIEINTYGIECDYTQQHTPCIRNNGLNPIWDCKFHIDVYCPELCLVKFEVRDDDHYHRSAFVGQACFPFTALQLGYRHIKLRAKDGDYIRGTLFVHIKIENL